MVLDVFHLDQVADCRDQKVGRCGVNLTNEHIKHVVVAHVHRRKPHQQSKHKKEQVESWERSPRHEPDKQRVGGLQRRDCGENVTRQAVQRFKVGDAEVCIDGLEPGRARRDVQLHWACAILHDIPGRSRRQNVESRHTQHVG